MRRCRYEFSEADNRKYIAEAPHDPVRYYMVGLSHYCGGKVAEGINYMEKLRIWETLLHPLF